MTIIAWLVKMGMGIIRAAQSRNHANSPGERRGEFSPSDITALQRFMSEGWKCGNMPWEESCLRSFHPVTVYCSSDLQEEYRGDSAKKEERWALVILVLTIGAAAVHWEVQVCLAQNMAWVKLSDCLLISHGPSFLIIFHQEIHRLIL